MSDVDAKTLASGSLALLIERIDAIARRLDRLDANQRRGTAFFDRHTSSEMESALIVSARTRNQSPSLPDPRLLRSLLAARSKRVMYFPEANLADPAWDMMLDLAAAQAEGKSVSITSLCVASGVPNTTALRWIGSMVETGLLERVDDTCDKRRAYVRLSEPTARAMARYFDEVVRTMG